MEKRSTKVLLLWLFLIFASVGTYFLSNKIETGTYGAAAIFLANGTQHEFSLYADRVEPSDISARPGDEIVFKIKDGSHHNISEERESRHDARLESGTLGKGESYSLIFQDKGIYYFYDRMNQDIHATIVIK